MGTEMSATYDSEFAFAFMDCCREFFSRRLWSAQSFPPVSWCAVCSQMLKHPAAEKPNPSGIVLVQVDEPAYSQRSTDCGVWG
jgi:hypothetical protein